MPIVTCEILPIYDATLEVGRFRLKRHEQINTLMKSLGYECFRMQHDAWLEPAPEVQVYGDLELSDYVFLPPGLKAEMLEQPL